MFITLVNNNKIIYLTVDFRGSLLAAVDVHKSLHNLVLALTCAMSKNKIIFKLMHCHNYPLLLINLQKRKIQNITTLL